MNSLTNIMRMAVVNIFYYIQIFYENFDYRQEKSKMVKLEKYFQNSICLYWLHLDYQKEAGIIFQNSLKKFPDKPIDQTIFDLLYENKYEDTLSDGGGHAVIFVGFVRIADFKKVIYYIPIKRIKNILRQINYS